MKVSSDFLKNYTRKINQLEAAVERLKREKRLAYEASHKRLMDSRMAVLHGEIQGMCRCYTLITTST